VNCFLTLLRFAGIDTRRCYGNKNLFKKHILEILKMQVLVVPKHPKIDVIPKNDVEKGK